MKRRAKTTAILVCAGIFITQYPGALIAANEAEVQEAEDDTAARNFYNTYGYAYPDVSISYSVFDGYLIYLQSGPQFQAQVNAIWTADGNPSGSIRNLVLQTVDVVNATDLDEATVQALAGQVSMIQTIDGGIPSVIIKSTPFEPEPEPVQPENPDPSNPENPEKPSDPSKPSDKPDKPSQGEDEPDPIPGNKDEDKKDDSDKKDPDKNSNKDDSSKDKDKKDEDDEEKKDKTLKDTFGSNKQTNIPNYSSVSVKALSKTKDRLIKVPGLGAYNLLPDYTNAKAWRASASPYNTPYLWGQCTWFAWGRFYEIYGFDPGFSGDGYMCVGQLLARHPDKFVKSSTPAAGAVFSADAAHNHVGIVLEYDKATKTLTVQEGNLDGVSNPLWKDAIEDYRTVKLTADDMKKLYGNVTYAVPKATLQTVMDEEVSASKVKTLRTLAEERMKKSFASGDSGSKLLSVIHR